MKNEVNPLIAEWQDLLKNAKNDKEKSIAEKRLKELFEKYPECKPEEELSLILL